MTLKKFDDWEEVGEVPAAAVQAFENVRVCERAVQKIVKTCVKEAEIADMAEQSLWEVLKEEYSLDMNTYTYQLLGNKLMRRTVAKNGTAEFLETWEKRKNIKASLKEKIFGKKKK